MRGKEREKNGIPDMHNEGLRQWRYGCSKKRLKSAKLCKQLRRKDRFDYLLRGFILDLPIRIASQAVITRTSNLHRI